MMKNLKKWMKFCNLKNIKTRYQKKKNLINKIIFNQKN